MSVPVETRPLADPLHDNVERRTWDEFRSTGLLVVANTVLHWFGWAVVVVTDDSSPDKVIDAYPARVKWRGFTLDRYELGMRRLTDWMANAGASLQKDIADD